ncbi:hypothetical protein QE152_g10204 [Popillia japonica]|uniref:Uncharacterized protein n=1 Tax=Popillia japonica TaxID=7064 RepID=A0AAW1LSE7_POPJA
MDTKLFYGKRKEVIVAVSVFPEESEDDGDDEDDALATQNGSSDEDDMSLTLRGEVALAHEASTTTTRLQVATPEPSTARGNIPLVWTNTDRISCNVPVWKRQLPSESSVRLPSESSVRLPMKYFRKLFQKDLFTHIVAQTILYAAQKDVGSNLLIEVEAGTSY